jgi:hypothetical protein
VWVLRNQSAVEQDADEYLHALGTGDGESACSRMTPSAQVELAARYGRDTCPQAVAELLRPLTPAQREGLARTRAKQSTDRGTPPGYMYLGGNPLRLTRLVLTKVDGKWLVTQLS